MEECRGIVPRRWQPDWLVVLTESEIDARVKSHTVSRNMGSPSHRAKTMAPKERRASSRRPKPTARSAIPHVKIFDDDIVRQREVRDDI